jgi:ABC-type nitrate/sulfonate/bicarbonate transport system substrate-binding protein
MRHLRSTARSARTLAAVVCAFAMPIDAGVPALAQTANVETINVGTFGQGIGPWCIDVAQDRGFFDQAGVKVASTIVLYGDAPIISALISRQVDIVFAGTGTLVPQANGQTDQIAVVGGGEGYPVSLVAPDSITSAAQLVGKTIDMPDKSSSLTIIGTKQVDALVGKGKWNAIYSGGANAAHFALLAGGQVQAVLVNDPVTLPPDQHLHILARLNAGQAYNNGPILTTKAFLQAKPQAAIRFLAGVAAGCNYILNPKNRTVSIDILSKYSEVDREACAQAYDFYVAGPQRGRTPPFDARLDRKAYVAAVNLLKEAGTVTEKNWDPLSVVDESYLDKALKIAGKLH